MVFMCIEDAVKNCFGSDRVLHVDCGWVVDYWDSCYDVAEKVEGRK